MPTMSGAKAEERLAFLTSELAKVGLPSFESVEGRLPYLRGGELTRDEVVALVNSFVQRGYPNLENTVKILAPAMRQQMLQERNCWIQNDPRCALFITGSGEYPDLASLEIAIDRDRKHRKSLLEEELQNQGRVLARSSTQEEQTDENPSVSSMDKYISRKAYGLNYAAGTYINEGIGMPAFIAYAVAAEGRREELASALSERRIRCPKEVLETLCSKFRKSDSIQKFQETIQHSFKPKHAVVASFILGEAGTFRVSDLALMMENERETRREIVASRAAEFSLDLKDLWRGDDYFYLLKEIDYYVEDGSGDGRSIVTTIAFDEELRKNALPDRRYLFSEVPSYKERFEDVSVKSGDTVVGFVRDLAEARDKRCRQVTESYISAKEDECRRELCVGDEQRKRIEQSEYVQFGICSIDSVISSLQEDDRHERLVALLEATPALLSPHLSSRSMTDNRLVQFIEGRSTFVNVLEVVSELQKEEGERMAEIEKLMKDMKLNTDNISKLSKGHPVHLYIAEGTGSPEALVRGMIKDQREKRFRDLLGSSIPPKSLSRISELSEYRDFVEGRTNTACEDLVSQLIDGREKRKYFIEDAFGGTGETEVSLRDDGQRALSDVITDYVEVAKGDICWIAEAIQCHARFTQIKWVFQDLDELLPIPDFEDVEAWKEELQQVRGKIIEKIVDESICIITGVAKQDSAFRTSSGDDLSVCISAIIGSFCVPGYRDSMQFGLRIRESKHRDERLVQLLVSSEACPWTSAKAVVEEIRRERRTRIEAFDRAFDPDKYSKICFLCGTSTSHVGGPTAQDKGDGILDERGPRADYVHGLISFDDAIDATARMERKALLREELASESLDASLATKNQSCIDFVDSCEAKDTLRDLFRLILTLKNRREERCCRLEGCFSKAGFFDACIPELPIFHDADSDASESCYRYTNSHDSSFPDKAAVSRLRFQYVERGQGSPEDVLRAFVMCKRAEKLESAVGTNWMRRSKKCKKFVSMTEAGRPSKEELKGFLKTIERKTALIGSQNGTAVDGDTGEGGSDDDRSSYSGYHDDDADSYGSGDLYGHDPYSAWGAFWD